MSDDQINIEVDGKSVKAKKGQMIIEATDEHGSYVPRFCYHSKLSTRFDKFIFVLNYFTLFSMFLFYVQLNR